MVKSFIKFVQDASLNSTSRINLYKYFTDLIIKVAR